MPEHHLRQLKELTMSPVERETLRHRLQAFAIAHPAQATPSAWIWRQLLRHSALALGLAFLVVVGATSVTAEASRPGDFLYGFRLTVNDRVETALAFSDDAQIDVEMEQLQRMLDDEESVRDDELDELAFTPADDSDVRQVSPAAESFYDEEFESELRSIERELQEEERVQLELD